MNYNINREIENQIYDAIDLHLEDFLNGKTFGTRHAKEILTKDDFMSYFDNKEIISKTEIIKKLKDAKRKFNTNKNIKLLISDLKYPGNIIFRKMNSDLSEEEINVKYTTLVKKIFNNIIIDRIALEKDKNNKQVMENKITKFSQYNMINEMKVPVMNFEEILDEVSKISNKTLKTVLVTFFKTYLEYIDLTDKNKHIFRINDMEGDVLNNHRVSFDVIIFDKIDIQQIKMNIIDYAIGEFYTTLPESVDVFGISMKPSSFINKEELKTVFEGQISDQVTIDTISNITNFKFIKQFNDFFIWSNQQINIQK